MTDHQSAHAPGCWSWGPKHYDCAVREIERLREQLRLAVIDQAIAEAEANDVRRNAGVHVMRAGQPVAQDVEAMVEALEAALMVMTSLEVRLEKQADAITMVRSQLALLRDAVHAAQAQAANADNEVVFIDGVGAARSSVKSCRDGVQWIRVGDRVYWPLSDSDAKRLHSACCGNGSFDGPATPASEGDQP